MGGLWWSCDNRTGRLGFRLGIMTRGERPEGPWKLGRLTELEIAPY
jgi:hypothetical protein